jgi:hypothetical protein
LDNLKDVILQTLEELDKTEVSNEENEEKTDIQFLEKLRERILVLFEGLQSPNINNLDKKLDLTINFLEYTLAEIDKKLSV